MPYYDTVTKVWEKRMVVPLNTWTAIRYGSDNAVSRKYIGIYNRSPYRIYITTDNTADPAHTRVVRQGGERIFPYSDKVTLYGMSATTGGATIVVTEECG
tara:strand:+ start:624 stop:923 length:300 start_codon:yes stop_codon:yes gene_type:complete